MGRESKRVVWGRGHLAVAMRALLGIPVRPAKTRRDASPPPGVAGEMIAMEVTLSLEEIDSTGQRVCPRTTRTVARSTCGMLTTVTRTLSPPVAGFRLQVTDCNKLQVLDCNKLQVLDCFRFQVSDCKFKMKGFSSRSRVGS